MAAGNPSQADEALGTVELSLGTKAPAASIRLPARVGGVAVVRQFMTGVSAVLHLDEQTCEDLKLATTEAATNCVVHAYPSGETGSMEVEVRANDHEQIVVVVRDRGRGVPDGGNSDGQGGYGLALIEAVSDGMSLDPVEGGGTEVAMRFSRTPTSLDEALDAVHSPVLRRVVAIMAANAGFSMDRLSDAVLVAETLAAQTPRHATNGAVRVAMEDMDREIVMRVGPLVEGGAGALLGSSRLPAYGPILEHLADGVQAEAGSNAEYLVVRLAPRA